MNPELNPNDIGSQLGADGVNSVVTKVGQYCAHEERRIALENHAPIVTMRAELSLLLDEERRIQEQLRDAPPPGDLRHHRRKVIFAWAITVILTITGFFLAALTFAPFRLGWQGYLFCLGIATVVPFLVENLLESPRLEVLVKSLTALAVIAGIASLMLLADVRGHLLAQEIQNTPTVVIDDSQPEQAPTNDFYGATLNALRLATVLLSFAMELGAGLALREAWSKDPHNTEEWRQLRDQLTAVRRQMILAAGQITRLEDESAIFQARFWRDFYRSMLTHTVRSAVAKLLMIVVVVVLTAHAHAETPQHRNLVIAIDLTKSVDVKGPDGTTEFQKNVDGVTRVLAQVPAGAHVTVIGITDHSFTQPYILLSASFPDDAGYFGERLNAGRQQLVKAWRERSAKLRPTFAATDILGELEVASQIFEQSPRAERKVLILFSDMRNHTTDLDLESERGLARALHAPSYSSPPADLRGVHVFALGVDGDGRTIASWMRVSNFWKSYLDARGASLEGFSVLREIHLMSNQ